MTKRFDLIVENILHKPMKWVDVVKQFSKQQLADAREWISDCQWRDLDPEDIEHLTDVEIVKGVGQNYDGGWRSFLQDNPSQDENQSVVNTTM
jgi:hypothetical protein